jgi:hypothetical protein
MIKLDIFFDGENFITIAFKIKDFKTTDLSLNGIKPIYQNILKKYFY